LFLQLSKQNDQNQKKITLRGLQEKAQASNKQHLFQQEQGFTQRATFLRLKFFYHFANIALQKTLLTSRGF